MRFANNLLVMKRWDVGPISRPIGSLSNELQAIQRFKSFPVYAVAYEAYAYDRLFLLQSRNSRLLNIFLAISIHKVWRIHACTMSINSPERKVNQNDLSTYLYSGEIVLSRACMEEKVRLLWVSQSIKSKCNLIKSARSKIALFAIFLQFTDE